MLVTSRFSALAAIALWASLASLANATSGVPVFLKTGLSLIIGSLIAFPVSRFKFRNLKVNWKTLVIGVYGLLGYHSFLFLAFAFAPEVQANLINYLWPLLIVLLAPMFIRSQRLTGKLLLAALIGFFGAGIAILSKESSEAGFYLGYLFAFIAAIIWATYTLATKTLPAFPTSAVGTFALISGIGSLALHVLLESPASLTSYDLLLIVLMGLGPLGSAFYFWDYAIKHGDPQQIGLLSFLTPLLSTILLLTVTGEPLTWLLALAAALIIGGALLGQVKK